MHLSSTAAQRCLRLRPQDLRGHLRSFRSQPSGARPKVKPLHPSIQLPTRGDLQWKTKFEDDSPANLPQPKLQQVTWGTWSREVHQRQPEKKHELATTRETSLEIWVERGRKGDKPRDKGRYTKGDSLEMMELDPVEGRQRVVLRSSAHDGTNSFSWSELRTAAANAVWGNIYQKKCLPTSPYLVRKGFFHFFPFKKNSPDRCFWFREPAKPGHSIASRNKVVLSVGQLSCLGEDLFLLISPLNLQIPKKLHNLLLKKKNNDVLS